MLSFAGFASFQLHVFPVARVASCTCCLLHVLPVTRVASCLGCQLHMLPFAHVTNCLCCQLQISQTKIKKITTWLQ